jgi:hypothetical protein
VTPQVRGRALNRAFAAAVIATFARVGDAGVSGDAGVAFAEEPVKSESGHRLTADLDGTYVTAGPVAAAQASQNNWNSAVGAELSLVHLREGAWPALFGIALGGVVFDSEPGLRTWIEAEAAIDRLPVKLGISAGFAAKWDRVDPPHLGAQATLWAFAGVVPYVRIGALDGLGSYFEVGLMIKVPVKIRY